MRKTIKKCLYDGRIFTPKRSNQKYSCNKSRIAFHNRRYKEIRKKLTTINNRLYNNYIIINELMDLKKETILNNNFLIGKGFNFKHLTHIIAEENNEIYYGLYEYLFIKINNNETKFIYNESY